jgi:hypothetical protein
MQTENDDALRYVDADPGVEALRKAYDLTRADLSYYFEQTRAGYDDRRALWPGKSTDLRKHGPDAFPWDGASDNEAQVTNTVINTYVALLLGSLKRANIMAFPAEPSDAGRAKVMSAFFKWMRNNYVRDFFPQAERART